MPWYLQRKDKSTLGGIFKEICECVGHTGFVIGSLDRQTGNFANTDDSRSGEKLVRFDRLIYLAEALAIQFLFHV